MLPRLIEIGPGLFSTAEWAARRRSFRRLSSTGDTGPCPPARQSAPCLPREIGDRLAEFRRSWTWSVGNRTRRRASSSVCGTRMPASACEPPTLWRNSLENSPISSNPIAGSYWACLRETNQKEMRWHLALMVPRLRLTASECRRAADLLLSDREDKSSIVKTFALARLGRTDTAVL